MKAVQVGNLRCATAAGNPRVADPGVLRHCAEPHCRQKAGRHRRDDLRSAEPKRSSRRLLPRKRGRLAGILCVGLQSRAERIADVRHFAERLSPTLSLKERQAATSPARRLVVELAEQLPPLFFTQFVIDQAVETGVAGVHGRAP